MRNFAVALALLGVVGFTAPALADCITDINEARKIVNSMPEGWQKEAAMRELKLAEEAAAMGDEKMCVVHVGVCAQYTGAR